MHRWISIVLGLVAAVSTGLAVLYHRENNELRRILAEQRASAFEHAQAPEEPAVGDEPVASPAVVESASTEGQPPAPPEGFRSGRFERMAEGMSRMLSDPESRAAMMTRMKSRVDQRFGDLFVSLGLDEVQVETLRTLLAEQQMAQMEAGMLMRTAETDEAREEARLWREAKMESLESGLETVLGPDAQKTLREYTRSEPLRESVSEIARRASYVGAPMSQQESTRLVEVMQSVGDEIPLPKSGDQNDAGGRRDRQSRTPVTPEYVEKYLDQLQAQNSEVLTRSRGFLTDAQLEALADKQIESFEAAQQQLSFQLRNPDMGFGRGGDSGRRRGGGGP